MLALGCLGQLVCLYSDSGNVVHFGVISGGVDGFVSHVPYLSLPKYQQLVNQTLRKIPFPLPSHIFTNSDLPPFRTSFTKQLLALLRYSLGSFPNFSKSARSTRLQASKQALPVRAAIRMRIPTNLLRTPSSKESTAGRVLSGFSLSAWWEEIGGAKGDWYDR